MRIPLVGLALFIVIPLLGCQETIVPDLDLSLDKPVQGAFASTFPAAAWMREQSLDELTYWLAREQDGRRIGFWFPAANWGYRSTIEGLLAISDDGLIQGFAVTEHEETLFFWLLIPENWFEGFSGLDAALMDVDTRDFGPYPIDAVTGATVSSQAVIQDVWDGLDLFDRASRNR